MDLIYILTLMLTNKIGRGAVRQIVNSAEERQFKISAISELIGFVDESRNEHPDRRWPLKEDLWAAYDRSMVIINKCETFGIDILHFKDRRFPQRLLNIPNAPTVLYVRGPMGVLNYDDSVAVIGTRDPTEYGKTEGFRLAKEFAEKGYVIVSGLALGCDTIAHRGCLAANGRTIAVMPSGVDTIYPRSNQPLAEEIIDKGGCLVSEYEIGSGPLRHTFVERDRLQSGLSKAVVVIETDIKGGSMHTVSFAQKQGRRLACLLSHPARFLDQAQVQGNKKLVSEGQAVRLGSLDDITQFLERLKNEPEEKVTSNDGKTKKGHSKNKGTQGTIC